MSSSTHFQQKINILKFKLSTLQKTFGNDTKYHTACPPIPHTPCPRTQFTQAKKWQLMHNKTHAEYFYSIAVVW